MSRAALRHLQAADPKLARVIARVGPCRFAPRSEGTHFDALCRAIIYQQLSGKAAGTIHRRFEALYGGRPPAPGALLATRDEALREVGLSRQKASYLKDLAGRAASGELPVETLHELDDRAVIDTLIQVKGVGVWSAHMFLIFRLGRPDVLPVGDLGIRKAVQRAYRLRALPPPEKVAAIGAPWRPYATYAAWYLWRSLETETP